MHLIIKVDCEVLLSPHFEPSMDNIEKTKSKDGRAEAV